MIAEARVWLDTHTHTPGPTVAPTRTRSMRELEDRRDTLDTIVAAAPPDHRGLIDQLRTGGTLPFDDVAEMLTDALAAQGERRRWILEHWPHVVEYTQIAGTIDHGLAGPDPTSILDTLTGSSHSHLADAASACEPWLVTLAAQLTAADTNSPSADVVQLLGDVAGYRHRWDITHPDPLGVAARDPEQAAERLLLSIAIDHADDWAHPDRTLDVDRVERDELTLASFDDDLGW